MKFLNKFKKFLFFLLLCLGFLLLIFFINNFFLIKKVELISEKNFLLINKDQLINQNLIFINQKSIADKIVLENYSLKSATVEKVWPSSLKITVDFYQPIAALVVSQGYFNLSAGGRILSKTKDNQFSLPVINYYQKLRNESYSSGDFIKFNDIQQVLFFIEKLEQINLKPLTIDIRGEDMLVFSLSGDKKILFSILKKKEDQDYQLELIIRQFKIEGKDYKTIDLRFNKPVIEF